MSTDTPAEELRAAVARLREKAAAAREEIRTNPYWSGGEVTFADGINNACGGAGGELAALLSPEAAEPLALLLEDQAAMYEDFLPHGADMAERVVWHCLAVARQINGGAS